MLQIRKVIEHVYEKVLGQGSDDGSQSAQHEPLRPDLDPEDLTAAALERVEIYCNDQVKITEHLSRASPALNNEYQYRYKAYTLYYRICSNKA